MNTYDTYGLSLEQRRIGSDEARSARARLLADPFGRTLILGMDADYKRHQRERKHKMPGKTKIEWATDTWNPVTGCTEVSPGCAHCYAKTFAERWRGTEGHPYEQGFDVTLRPARLSQPANWTRPRQIFVNSMSDLFHEAIPTDYIEAVYQAMSVAPQHDYLILTKRHDRMTELLAPLGILDWAGQQSNFWHGVSVENQRFATVRIPRLMQLESPVRFLSCEPLLAPLDLRPWLHALSWVIVGGESGHGRRPFNMEWARSIRDQCAAAGVPFFMKQVDKITPIPSDLLIREMPPEHRIESLAQSV